MKLRLFKTIGICATALSICMNCYAAQKPDVEYKYNDSKVIVSGDALEGESFITLQILKADKSFNASYTDFDVLFCDQIKPVDGKYSFEVEFDCDTDEYAMRVASNVSIKDTGVINLVEERDFEYAYWVLSQAAKKADNGVDLEKAINDYRAELNFGFSLTDNVEELSVGAELKDYYAYIKEYVKQNDKLLMNKESENTAIFKTYMTAYYLNQ